MLLDELTKTFDDPLIADLKIGAEAFGGTRFGRLTKQREDLIGKRIARRQI